MKLSIYLRKPAVIVGVLLLALFQMPGHFAYAQDTMRVTTRNVHEFLKKMETQTKLGMQVNEHIKVLSTKASGKTFSIRYTVNAASLGISPADFTYEDQTEEEKGMCAQKNLVALMKYGAIFERIYQDENSDVLYRASVSQKRCRQLR